MAWLCCLLNISPLPCLLESCLMRWEREADLVMQSWKWRRLCHDTSYASLSHFHSQVCLVRSCTFCFHPSQRGMEVAVDGKGNGQMSTTWQTVLLWTLNQLFIVLFHLYLSFSPSFSNHSIHWVFLIYNRTIPWDRLGSFTDWNWPRKLSYMAEQKVWSQVSLIQVQNVVLTSNRWARNTSNFVFLKDYTQTAHSIRTWIEKVFSKNVHSI